MAKGDMLTCPECGVSFTAHHQRQVFCTPKHKAAFYNLAVKRGLVLLPLMQVHRYAQPRYANGAPVELANYARRQAEWLLSQYNAEDRKAGRNPALVVEAKRDEGWIAADLAAFDPGKQGLTPVDARAGRFELGPAVQPYQSTDTGADGPG